MTQRPLPAPEILGDLGEARVARLLEERAERLARRGAAPQVAAAAPVLVLAVGAERFGLDLRHVAEVLPVAPPTPLPGSPPAVLGLRARGGRLHTVLDLATLLGIIPDRSEASAGGHDVLLRPGPRAAGTTGNRRFALRVGRALAAQAPLPLPPEHAPPSTSGAVAFHARLQSPASHSPGLAVAEALGALPGAEALRASPEAETETETILAVLDLDRLLRPFAASSSPAPGA
jgi:purine-binding chemotaxis protein CheW